MRVPLRMLFLLTLVYAIFLVRFVSAQELRQISPGRLWSENIVKIKAQLQLGSPAQVGFGFIVGKQSDKAVIVTANHVVRDEDDFTSVARNPSVTFFHNRGVEVEGELQLTFAPKFRGDVAVILAPWPTRLAVTTSPLNLAPLSANDSVWFVGKGDIWDQNVTPGRFVTVEANGQDIKVAGLSVSIGSSGGPLLSRTGIIGMIVADDPQTSSVKATSIDAIESLVKDEWNYDWSLARVPLRAISSRFSHATGFFIEKGNRWIEFPAYKTRFGQGNFSFVPAGVVDGYLYLVDPSRPRSDDPNRPFTLRIPIQGGMVQWSFPNPWEWRDLYVVQPDR